MRLSKLMKPVVYAGLLSVSLTGLPLFSQDFVLPYNKTPESVGEYWAAVKYEMSLGNHQRTAVMFKGFYDKLAAMGEEDQKKFLLGVYDRDTITPMLKLSSIAPVRELKIQDQILVDNVQKKLTGYLETRLSDPDRIKFFVGNLNKSREERAYAITQLRSSGARSIPAFVSILRDRGQANLHGGLLSGLLQMDKDIAPPLLAALSAKDNNLRSMILQVFASRGDDRVVPYLNYLRATPSASSELQKQATQLLSKFTGQREGFGDPRQSLINEAEKYYLGKSPSMDATTVWNWSDSEGLTRFDGTKSHYEEAQALGFAKKALEIDPSYAPAQVELLSIGLDKTYERNGPAADLAKVNPQLQGLIAASSPDVLDAVLAKAIADKKTNVVLGASRALAHSGNGSSLKAGERGYSPLLAAMQYPDQRSRFAAADSALTLSGPEGFEGSSRAVSVMTKSLGFAGRPKAVVGLADAQQAQQLVASLQSLGYDASAVRSGTQLFSNAVQNGADLFVIDNELADPGFAHFVGSYKSNPEFSSTPMLVFAGNKVRQATESLSGASRVKVLETPPMTADLLKVELAALSRETNTLPISDAERQSMAKAGVNQLLSIAKSEKSKIDLRLADGALLFALQNDLIAAEAAQALSYRMGSSIQPSLAQAITNPNRSPEVRLALGKALQQHILRYGVQLNTQQVQGIIGLANDADANLKMQGDRLAALLRSDAAQLGNRLKELGPAKSGTPAAAPAKTEPGN